MKVKHPAGIPPILDIMDNSVLVSHFGQVRIWAERRKLENQLKISQEENAKKQPGKEKQDKADKISEPGQDLKKNHDSNNGLDRSTHQTDGRNNGPGLPIQTEFSTNSTSQQTPHQPDTRDDESTTNAAKQSNSRPDDEASGIDTNRAKELAEIAVIKAKFGNMDKRISNVLSRPFNYLTPDQDAPDGIRRPDEWTTWMGKRKSAKSKRHPTLEFRRKSDPINGQYEPTSPGLMGHDPLGLENQYETLIGISQHPGDNGCDGDESGNDSEGSVFTDSQVSLMKKQTKKRERKKSAGSNRSSTTSSPGKSPFHSVTSQLISESDSDSAESDGLEDKDPVIVDMVPSQPSELTLIEIDDQTPTPSPEPIAVTENACTHTCETPYDVGQSPETSTEIPIQIEDEINQWDLNLVQPEPEPHTEPETSDGKKDHVNQGNMDLFQPHGRPPDINDLDPPRPKEQKPQKTKMKRESKLLIKASRLEMIAAQLGSYAVSVPNERGRTRLRSKQIEKLDSTTKRASSLGERSPQMQRYNPY